MKFHPEIEKLQNHFQSEEKQGVYISDYEKLYQYNLLYSEACSRYHFLEAERKIIRENLYLNNKREGLAKTDKEAYGMAMSSDIYENAVEKVRVAEKYYLQLRAIIAFFQGKMESDKSKEISQNIEKRLSVQSGEGKY